MKLVGTCPLCVKRQERVFEIEEELAEKDEHVRELELQVARLERLHGNSEKVTYSHPIPDTCTVGGI